MLVKSFFETMAGQIRGACLQQGGSFSALPWLSSLGSLLLSLPFVPASKLNKQAYIDHLFTAVSMVCVTGLFTQSVASTYNGLGAVDLYALDPDWWLRDLMTFIGLFLYGRSVKSSVYIGPCRPFGTALAYSR